jgi:hypothetical protein
MEHFFDLPVDHKGEIRYYPARLVTFGYSFRFYVMIDETEVIFEKDDERKYRALAESTAREIDRTLVEAVIEALEEIQR